MAYHVEFLRKIQNLSPEIRDALFALLEEIEQTVTKTEFNELKNVVKELSANIKELAKAQKKTEEELKKLIGEHRKTREMVGGLAHTVGYILEDRAYKGLPELIKKDFGISIIEPFKRTFIQVAPKKYIELNIIGKGKRGEKEYVILGECKAQLKKRDVDKFLKTVEKLNNYFSEDKKLIFVTYQTSPEVESYIENKNLKIYYSYELPL